MVFALLFILESIGFNLFDKILSHYNGVIEFVNIIAYFKGRVIKDINGV